MEQTIGQRVRQLIAASPQRMLDSDVANRVGMTAPAFSLALSGKRGISSLELVRLAELFNVSVHWMITGEPDPFELRIAARHGFDVDRGYTHDPKPGEDKLLSNVSLAYRQAFPTPLADVGTPVQSASASRGLLGESFVEDFASQVEQKLGIGIVRVPGVGKAYSIRIGGRYCIVIGASGNWFFQNFSIAHELGHIHHGHFNDSDDRASDDEERQANRYAAEMLLPETPLKSLDWMSMTGTELADFVWRSGVSTAALRTRLGAIAVRYSPEVDRLLQLKTQLLLNQHLEVSPGTATESITRRMSAVATRRFPAELEKAHLDGISSGRLSKETLAWMLDIPSSELEVPGPTRSKTSNLDDLARELGLDTHGVQEC